MNITHSIAIENASDGEESIPVHFGSQSQQHRGMQPVLNHQNIHQVQYQGQFTSLQKFKTLNEKEKSHDRMSGKKLVRREIDELRQFEMIEQEVYQTMDKPVTRKLKESTPSGNHHFGPKGKQMSSQGLQTTNSQMHKKVIKIDLGKVRPQGDAKQPASFSLTNRDKMMGGLSQQFNQSSESNSSSHRMAKTKQTEFQGDGSKTQRGQLMKLQQERELLIKQKEQDPHNLHASKTAYETVGIQRFQGNKERKTQSKDGSQ